MFIYIFYIPNVQPCFRQYIGDGEDALGWVSPEEWQVAQNENFYIFVRCLLETSNLVRRLIIASPSIRMRNCP